MRRGGLTRASPSLILGIVLVLPGIPAASATAPSPDFIPPFIDAMDGIMPKGSTWNADPALWPHTAAIEHRNSTVGVNEAKIKLRIEGKGDPVQQSIPQQTVLVIDNTGSMASQDPSNSRCDGARYYIDQLVSPEEAGVADYNDSARLLSPLTTNYASARASVVCQAQGGSGAFFGLKTALDELIPKKKAGFVWAVIFQMDGWNTGGSPQPQVDRAQSESVRIYTICPGPSTGCDTTSLQQWAQQTGGKYYNPASPADYQQVYQDIRNTLTNDIAGKPPKTGAPMIRFKLTNDIEVVPNTFACDSTSCTAPSPSNPSAIVFGNKGLSLEWSAPVKELRIKQYWQVEFGVRSYRTGTQVKVNDVAMSYVEYDRYDGSPGGSDVFEQLYVDVINTCAGPCVTSVSISPTQAFVKLGTTRQFTAQAYDQSNQPLPGASYAWSVTGSAGSVDQTGLFTGTADGMGNVQVTATFNGSSKSTSASVTVDGIAPSVQSHLPADGAVEVPVASTVRIDWSEPMNVSSAEAAFSANPSISCAFTWSSQRFQTCQPSAPLARGTSFCVSVSAIARDPAGNQLGAQLDFCFTTAATPAVQSSSPANGSSNVPLTDPVVVGFNVPMDRASTEASFSIAPAVAGYLWWSPAGDTLNLAPTNSLARNTSYQVALAASARSAAGLNLAAPHTFNFRTADQIPPYIDAVDCAVANGSACPPDPANWTKTAAIRQKGSPSGATEAYLKIRMEGKGDPIKTRLAQQTVMVLDDSGSMTSNDPSNIRCTAFQVYADQLMLPDELGLAKFTDTAALLSPLTTSYGSVKSAIQCTSTGGSGVVFGLQSALDELIPKKKANLTYAVLLSMDNWNVGGDPKPQVDRAVANGIKIFTLGYWPDQSSADKQQFEPQMMNWSAQTGGKHYWIRNPNDIIQVYQDLAGSMSNDVAGKPPKGGAPMLNFKLTDDIEVVPASFKCESTSCTAPAPSSPAAILPNNKGLLLQWNAPVAELRIKQHWQVSFLVRSYTAGKQVKVNDMAQSFVEYDRYDGSPGGSDVFEQLFADVEPSPCAPACLSRVEISPLSATLRVGESLQFAASAYDTSNNPMQGVAFTWGANGGVGGVSQSGMFFAQATGVGEVWVKGTHSGIERTANASVEVLQKADTTPPAVLRTVPADGWADVPTGPPIEIHWSEPMSKADAEAAFTISPQTSCAWEWPLADLQRCVHPLLPEATAYEARIDTGARDLAGNPLASSYRFSFSTGRTPPDIDPPEISHTPPDPVDEGTSVTIMAEVTDASALGDVILRYRKAGTASFRAVAMTGTAGGVFSHMVPGDSVAAPALEYYFEASDEFGNLALSPASAPGELHEVEVGVPGGGNPTVPDPTGGLLVPIALIAIVAAAALTAGLVLAKRRRRPKSEDLPPPSIATPVGASLPAGPPAPAPAPASKWVPPAPPPPPPPTSLYRPPPGPDATLSRHQAAQHAAQVRRQGR